MMLKLNIEDIGLFKDWFSNSIRMHLCAGESYIPVLDSTVILHLHQHEKIDGMEVDFLVEATREYYPNTWDEDKGNKKKTKQISIIYEMKDSDLPMVLAQAVERRPLADYCYAVIALPTYNILQLLRVTEPKCFLDNGVGIISSQDNSIVIRSYSPRFFSESARHKTILSYIPLDEIKEEVSK